MRLRKRRKMILLSHSISTGSEVKSGKVNFKDFTTATPFKKTLTPINITVSNLSTSQYREAGLVFTLKKKAKESVKVDGRFSINPVAANLSLDLERINLAELQPYVDESLKLLVKRGYGAASGKLKLSAAGERGFSAAFNGGASVTRFSAVDNANFDDFLKMKSLAVKEIDLTYNSERTVVDINEILLSDFYTRLIIASDGNFNVNEITALNGEEAAEDESEETATSGEIEKEASKRPEITIAKVTLKNGSVNFSDKLVNAGYSTDLMEINGTVSSLSSRPDKRADLALTAKLDKYAPLGYFRKSKPALKRYLR